MKKHEVELIIVGLNVGKEQVVNMKIYKDGTICRSGCGGMPTFGISGMTIEGTKEFWDKSISLIDPKLIENSINHQDERISTPMEYFIAFYGVSDNGETGERANWTKSNGSRFVLDYNTSFRHPVLGFLDDFVVKVLEITNEWFFDIVMTAVYDMKPLGLENTFVTIPKTEVEKQEALSRYINQIMADTQRGWDIVKIGNGRKYISKDGKNLTSSVKNNYGNVSINFMEAFGKGDIESLNEKLKDVLAEQKNDSSTQKMNDTNQVEKIKPSASKSTKSWWEFWK